MYYGSLPLDYKNTFSRYTGFLKSLGIDIFDLSAYSNIRFVIFNITFLPFVCIQFSSIAYITAENFMESALNIPVSVMLVLDLIKMSTALLKKAEIRQMFLEIGELWPTGLEADDEKTFVMKTLGRRMRYLVDAFYTYACVNLLIFEAIPFMASCYNIYTGVNEYLFPFTLPGLWEVNTTTSFLITFVWEWIASIPSQIYLYMPYDLMIVILTSNISVLFRILQIDVMNAIQTFDDQKKKKQNLNIADPDSYEKLLKIVKTHQTLLRISGQLNNIFGLVIFVHVVFAAVVICFFGFLAVVNDDLAEKIIYIISVCNAVFTTFLLALSGQLLIDSSSSVSDAAYHSLWYESDMKVKKLILFIMIRTRRDTYLSALGFSDMTLKSFSKIMSTSWTYFSLLRQMYFQD